MYKNHSKLISITEIYLQKNKFRNEEKIKMLNSMKNSYVGLFKVINTDRNDGYITYEDVFTKKKFKVIDIAMSSTLKVDKRRMIYVYNRIITYGRRCPQPNLHNLIKKMYNNKYKFQLSEKKADLYKSFS